MGIDKEALQHLKTALRLGRAQRRGIELDEVQLGQLELSRTEVQIRITDPVEFLLDAEDGGQGLSTIGANRI